MQMSLSRVLKVVLVVVAIAGGSAAGSWAVATASDGARLRGPADPVQEPGYPVNARGETYGSALDAPSPEYEPELIRAIGVDGNEGYVRRDELYMPAPASPEEAVAESRQSSSREIPVFASDGVTIVDVFVVEGGGDEGIIEEVRRP